MMGPRFFIQRNGMEEVSMEEAVILNEQKHEAYWCFNGFKENAPRRIENLTEIRTFYVDTDKIPKEDVMKLCQENLTPSSVIETVRGFHLYWHLKVPIDTTSDPIHWGSWFREFVKSRLVPVFKADYNACDALRLLRPWGFRYWKDGSGQEVRLIYGDEFWYDLKQIEDAFPPKAPDVPPKSVFVKKNDLPGTPSNNIEDKLPADEWLKRLSGHSAVRGERFTLQSRGMVDQIYANGKETPCWVDMNGRIGSKAAGGPTAAQWVMWYGKTLEEARNVLASLL